MLADSRIHCRVQGRYITVFKRRGILSCIDSVCHHTGGDLTNGPLIDIEDLGVTAVICPLHRYKVDLQGYKVFEAVDFVGGKPTKPIWKRGKVMVQRAHEVQEDSEGVYVRLRPAAGGVCPSDRDSASEVCGAHFTLHGFQPRPSGPLMALD
eukprot:GSChrysophyteH1.ASY1.ANO1.2662.1 assembled CDS